MSELRAQVVLAAQSRVGKPFRHHFKPVNACEGGTITVEYCLQYGMDDEGYDCSGLVIVSICEALGLDTKEWPCMLRHAQQLATLATHAAAQPGDVRLFTSVNQRIHLGIAVSEEECVHSSGVTHFVEEGIVADKYGPFVDARTIALDSLCGLLEVAHKS